MSKQENMFMRRRLFMRRVGALSTTMLLVVSIGVALSVVAAPAQAATFVGCKFAGANPVLNIKKGLMATPRYWDATVTGAARWNAVAVPGTFQVVSGATRHNILLFEQSLVDPSIFAKTSFTCNGGTWGGNQTTFTWSTEGSAGLTAEQLRMVATHELGHSYGLDHSPTTTCSGTKSIMVKGPLKWSCGWGAGPWADDILGVNRLY